MLADLHDVVAEPSETGAADACRAMLCSSMPAPESPSPGASPLREPEPAHMRLGLNPLGPSFGLASPHALPFNAELGSGSPVSEQTPLAGWPIQPAGRNAGLRAPMTARLPAIKSRRRVLLCEPNVGPDPSVGAGQLAGHVLDSDAAAASQAGGWGGSSLSSPVRAAGAWLKEDAEEDALRQTGLWSPGSPIARRSPGAGLAAPCPNQAPPAACTPAPVFTAEQPAAANIAGASREAHAAPAAARPQLTADAHANPFTGFARVPSPVMRAPSAARAASSGSSGAARRALDMTDGLHARSCIRVPAKDGYGANAAPDPSPSAAAAAAADTRAPLACASQDPTSRPAKRRIKLPQCPALSFLSAASSQQQPKAPGSCNLSAIPAAASEGGHAGMPAQQGPGLSDKQPHEPPAAQASNRMGVVGGLGTGQGAEVHGCSELAGCGAVGEAGGAASGQAASEEQVPAARQLDDLSSVFSILL